MENMDYTAANIQTLVGELTKLFGKYPMGVTSAYIALSERLNDVVRHLDGDLSVGIVRKTVDLREMIGRKYDGSNGDYRQRLERLRLNTKSGYFKQRGIVACKLLGEIKPEPLRNANDMSRDVLGWIITSLTEARPQFSLGVGNKEERKKYSAELKEAYALQLALDGIPKEEDECKFLLLQELTVLRLIDCVSPICLLGYWQALHPKNPTAVAIHATAEEVLISLPCQEMSETEYIENGLLMLAALAETVKAACVDWETRVLCQQSTDYILKALDRAKKAMTICAALAESQNIDSRQWQNRCRAIMEQTQEHLEAAMQADICKHFELSACALSAYAENFDETDTLCLALVRY